MNRREMLASLSTLCGVLPEYQDLWSRSHACSDETREALLGAMQLTIGTDEELRATLEAMETKRVRGMVPPALVMDAIPEAPELPVWVPESCTRDRFQWRLHLEGGGEHGGDFQPSALPRLEDREVSGVRYISHGLRLPVSPGMGYHTAEILGPRERGSLRLIVTPEGCFQPAALRKGGRLWGFAVQLYAVRSRRNWGMGDFTDLRGLMEFTGASGGDLVGINPLHALFPHDPEQATPYSPSSRRDLNVLYLDVEAVPDFAECEEIQRKVRSPEIQTQLQALRGSGFVDYRGVAALKFPLLEGLYRHFREHHQLKGTGRGQAFEAFREERGGDLHGLALFQALLEHFHREDPSVWDWQGWPEAYRDPGSPQVRAFASAHGARVDFWEYLQWQADLQLAALGSRSSELGRGVGLYGDLAVGVNGGGAETWLHRDLYAVGASVGAPPDDFCLGGQDWGLPPLIPHQLVDSAFEPFISTLRANMRHTRALRIDHAMGLMRLFWVPGQMTPAEGAYVGYPFRELMGILALESQRNRCLIVGEDLGTVPPEIGAALGERAVLSCHPLYFERDGHAGSYKPPHEYPRRALVSVGTHDLPTLSGHWLGHDLELRSALNLFPSDELRDRYEVERAQSRTQLLSALEQEGLVDSGVPATMTAGLARAVHVFLARSPSMILVVQPEDVLGQIEQANLPGSLPSQYPSWRRKLALDLEEWAGDPRFKALVKAVGEARNRAPGAKPVIPRATYRLQFNREFTLARATELVPYLHTLGVSHCYASPLLKARPGSTHGYDITDHGVLNPEIGTPEDFDRFVDALHRHGMGLILDFVPNHMAVMGRDNAWWQDVLENGQASGFANFFDIDWRPIKEELHGKVLLPVLGDTYGHALEEGQLVLGFDGSRGEFRVDYGEHSLPLDPREYPRILAHGIENLASRLGESAPELLELESLTAAFGHLPTRDQVAPEAVAERSRDKEIHKQRLAALWARSEDIRLFIDENLRTFNGTQGDPQSFDLLHQLLQSQAFRLAYWRVASDEINYRRFFDVNDLAALRMELEPVFEAIHRLVLEWIRLGRIDGLRLDHPDGLYDPAAYFRRLLRRAEETLEVEEGSRPLYLVAEKILARRERLPEDWVVHGTTGYDFASDVNGLFVDGSAEHRLNRICTGFTGRRTAFDELLYRSKALIVRTTLASEWNVLANELSRIALSSRHTRDFTLNGLRDALLEVVACFPVYRTYITPGHLSDQDRHHLEGAVAAARKRNPELGMSVYDFIKDVLSGEIAQGRTPEYADRVSAFAMRFQQYTAPVMAKGMEDTCLYRFNRLVSLNDVGSDPRAFGTTLAAFHEANAQRLATCPHGMLATSTHDGKRSEDARLRIDAISEMPAAWKLTVHRWAQMNQERKTDVEGEAAPSRNDEYLLYQTLIGAWPLEPMDPEALGAFRERIERYMLKAIRESKEVTSWSHPNPAYEGALSRFVSSILGSPDPFLADVQSTVDQVARCGLLSGLSLVLLKITSPGVPDIYQGCEMPVFSMVDPDNRTAVDFEARRRALASLCALDEDPGTTWVDVARSLQAKLEDGRAKLFVTWRTLNFRREHPDLFQDGGYLPLSVDGPLADHLCAFARRWDGETAVIVAPRLFARLQAAGDAWMGNRIEVPAAGDYFSIFTRERFTAEGEGGRFSLPLGAVLAHFPVALLMGPSRRGPREGDPLQRSISPGADHGTP